MLYWFINNRYSNDVAKWNLFLQYSYNYLLTPVFRILASPTNYLNVQLSSVISISPTCLHTCHLIKELSFLFHSMLFSLSFTLFSPYMIHPSHTFMVVGPSSTCTTSPAPATITGFVHDSLSSLFAFTLHTPVSLVRHIITILNY